MRQALNSNIVEFEIVGGQVVLTPVKSVAGSLSRYAAGETSLAEVREKIWQEVVMCGKNKVLPDTNVILRYLLQDNKEQFFEAVREGATQAVFLESVLVECIYVRTKFYKVPKGKAVASLSGLLRYKGIMNDDKDAMLTVLSLYGEKSIDLVDCFVIAKGHQSLGVTVIIAPPEDIQDPWSQVPAETDSLVEYLAPVLDWLGEMAAPGDFVLIQGEFGATWLAVKEAFSLGLIPVYSTTRRQAVKEHLPNGDVEVRHLFSHVRFRRYEL